MEKTCCIFKALTLINQVAFYLPILHPLLFFIYGSGTPVFTLADIEIIDQKDPCSPYIFITVLDTDDILPVLGLCTSLRFQQIIILSIF
jgi:hypothetical protein